MRSSFSGALRIYGLHAGSIQSPAHHSQHGTTDPRLIVLVGVRANERSRRDLSRVRIKV